MGIEDCRLKIEDGRWRIVDPGLWIRDLDLRIEDSEFRIKNCEPMIEVQGLRTVLKYLRLRTEDKKNRI